MSGQIHGKLNRVTFAQAPGTEGATGRAIFTIVSKKTGTRYTYRVRRPKGNRDSNPILFVDVLTGPENSSDFSWIGMLVPMVADVCEFRHGSKSKIGADAPSVKAFAWVWKNLESEAFEFWHEGSCGRCGRALTVPESISTGIGPVCAGLVAA